MKKISLCLTNFNRHDSLIQSFEQVINDERIGEIIISDDCSDRPIYDSLLEIYGSHKKVKLHRNDVNIGMSLNKAKSVGLSTYDWCILLDSDNVIDSHYIDCLYELPEWEESTIYQPIFAYPNFNFNDYSGMTVDKNINKEILKSEPPMYMCFLNACNYFVNKKTYLSTYEHNPTVKEVDTMWHNYNHFKNEGKFYFVPKMQYIHTVHDGSGWLQNASENMKKSEEIKKMMLGL
jgi:glycosyltransferase involved in cell wall biosynthesis